MQGELILIMNVSSGLATMAEILSEIRKRLAYDYGVKRHKVARRIAFETHSDLGGIVLELVQNAEDAKATELIIYVQQEGLRVENNGQPFSERDLYSLCSFFASEKGLHSLGFFGVGFKSVLQLTETPYLISGPFFCKLEGGIDPYPASSDELPFIPSLGHTTFWLPWREGVGSDEVERCFLEKLQESGPEMLLFLDSLQKVKLEGVKNSILYYTQRDILKKEADLQVMRIIIEGSQPSEWLRLDMFAELPGEVVSYFLEKHALDEEERKRFSADIQVKVSLVIKIEDGNPVKIEGLAFAGLPTKKRTGFKFHVCTKFPTNLSREGLRDVQEDPFGKWLIERLAELAGRLPFELKTAGWFKPSMWLVFPAEGEGEGIFKIVEERLLATLRVGKYLYDSFGNLRSPADVFLAHHATLYELLASSELEQLSGLSGVDWVYADLRDSRVRKVLKSVGVREISAEEVICWVERMSCEEEWVKSRPVEWFVKLYCYLNTLRNSKLWERIKNLPVVMTRRRQLIRPTEAIFPSEREELLASKLGNYW